MVKCLSYKDFSKLCEDHIQSLLNIPSQKWESGKIGAYYGFIRIGTKSPQTTTGIPPLQSTMFLDELNFHYFSYRKCSTRRSDKILQYNRNRMDVFDIITNSIRTILRNKQNFGKTGCYIIGYFLPVNTPVLSNYHICNWVILSYC